MVLVCICVAVECLNDFALGQDFVARLNDFELGHDFIDNAI